MEIDGIVNIYKEKGYTSHDVVAIVRGIFKTKAGHTGTLDPDAEGVLPVCLGRATKLADYIASERKGYKAVVQLGVTTDTQDVTGNVLSRYPTAGITEDMIKNAVQSFQGDQEQLPPMYSAVKVQGRKLYELARKGIEIERKKRPVTFYEINILQFISTDMLELDIVCSKGAYIRTLCHDIGQMLGCGGAMASLVRTCAGGMLVKDSIKIDRLKALAQAGGLDSVVIPMAQVLGRYPRGSVLAAANKLLYNGNKFPMDFIEFASGNPEGNFLAYDHSGRLIGIYVNDGGNARPVTILTDLNTAKDR